MRTILLLSITLSIAFGVDVLQEYSASNHKFASDLYRELTKSSSQNLIYSPLSAQLILSLTRLGAKGKTAEEFNKALSLPSDPEVIKKAVKKLDLLSTQQVKPYTLNSVNKLYVKDGYSIKPSYIELAKNVFSADVENIDFSKTEEAAKQVNQYIEEKTEHLLKNVIKPDDLDDLTRLVLINTLYFKGNWIRQFNDYTEPIKFSKSLTESKQIKLMTATSHYKYMELPELDAQYLEVPYEGEDVFLHIILPKKIDGLSLIEKNLNKVFEQKNATYERVEFNFPKFEIESDLKLKEVLEKLGVHEAFNEQTADLSEVADPSPRLYVSDVIQKSYIKFTESGTTAAAATVVFEGVPYSSLPPPTPIKFQVDHPFFFYLTTQDFVLFAGRVISPEAIE